MSIEIQQYIIKMTSHLEYIDTLTKRRSSKCISLSFSPHGVHLTVIDKTCGLCLTEILFHQFYHLTLAIVFIFIFYPFQFGFLLFSFLFHFFIFMILLCVSSFQMHVIATWFLDAVPIDRCEHTGQEVKTMMKYMFHAPCVYTVYTFNNDNPNNMRKKKREKKIQVNYNLFNVYSYWLVYVKTENRCWPPHL